MLAVVSDFLLFTNKEVLLLHNIAAVNLFGMRGTSRQTRYVDHGPHNNHLIIFTKHEVDINMEYLQIPQANALSCHPSVS